MLDQHIEDQINSFARDNKDASKKAAAGKAATEKLKARKQGLKKTYSNINKVLKTLSQIHQKIVIAGTKTSAEKKVAVIEAAPKQRKKRQMSSLKYVNWILEDQNKNKTTKFPKRGVHNNL